MSGITRLATLESSDMIDVVHVLFEEDSTPAYEQHMEVKSRVREMIYGDFYGSPYRYAYKTNTQQEALGFDPDMELPEPTRETKPYIPPTNPEDLPGILDAPLG
jgi:hypothetical protein